MVSPQDLKTISSSAKSFPQPPTPLLSIFNITDVWLGKDWNTRAYCCQLGLEVPFILPVSPLASRLVSVLSQISNFTFIGIPMPPQREVGSKLIIHEENS